jgi:hypothetical protein
MDYPIGVSQVKGRVAGDQDRVLNRFEQRQTDHQHQHTCPSAL